MTGAGLGLAFLAGIIIGIPGVVLVAAAGVLILLTNRNLFAVTLVAVGLAVLGMVRAVDPPSITADHVIPTSMVGRVESIPASTRVGQQFNLVTESSQNGDTLELCVSAVNLEGVRQGEMVRISGAVLLLEDLPARRAAALQGRGCQAAFEPDELVVLGRASAGVQLINTVRRQIGLLFQRVAPGDSGALMTGLLTGDDSALTWESRSAFLSTGTTHITAVSGANFAILVTVASMLAGGSGNRRRWRWIIGVSISIWSYAVLVGLPPSAVRAALMATLALLAARFGRIPDFLTLLMVSVILHLTIRPGDLHTMSFQLSVAATLALILVFSGWRRSRYRVPLAIVISAAAAHLATVPILVWHIGEVSLTSIPANSAITPMVMLAFPLVAVAGVAGLLVESLGVVVASVAALFASGIVHTVLFFDELFGDAIVIGQMPDGAKVMFAIGCWGLIGLASRDVRAMGAHLWEWGRMLR